MRAAVEAVQLASRLCMATQDILSRDDRAAKRDDSPVTVADFAAQALVSLWLERTHPEIQLVAEETADALRAPEGASLSRRVTRLVNETLRLAISDGFIDDAHVVARSVSSPLTESFVADAIDRGAGSPRREGAFWILDPIDGTGLHRREAIRRGARADGGRVRGRRRPRCPNMPTDVIPEDATYTPSGRERCSPPRGWNCRASRRRALAVVPDRAKPVRADAGVIPETSRYMESWGDSIVANGGKTKALAAELGIVRTAVRVDSMAKYGALSRGDADLYLRFPPPSYREKVWDHAAGVAIVQCAGGVITDGEGRALDFTKGRFLEQRGGIIASANPSFTPPC